MPVHQYEARCVCGNRWRVYRNDVEGDDDPMATCVNCGANTFDLTDIGEVRSIGRDMQA
jgi:predicted nucleic acid-binding Zn ribbon protein